MLEKALGGQYSHVPYRGAVQALQDVGNGTLDLTWASPVSARMHSWTNGFSNRSA